jgi:hypothetical protein
MFYHFTLIVENTWGRMSVLSKVVIDWSGEEDSPVSI